MTEQSSGEKFIVENEKEFWKIRLNRIESRIKYWLKFNVKVVMSGKDAVGIISPTHALSEDNERELLTLAEDYIYTLNKIKMKK